MCSWSQQSPWQLGVPGSDQLCCVSGGISGLSLKLPPEIPSELCKPLNFCTKNLILFQIPAMVSVSVLKLDGQMP